LARRSFQAPHGPKTVLGLVQTIAAASERPALLRKLFGPHFSRLAISSSRARGGVSRQLVASALRAAKLSAAATTTRPTTVSTPAPEGLAGSTATSGVSSDSVTGGVRSHDDGRVKVTSIFEPCPGAGGVLHATVGNSISNTTTVGPFSSARLRTIATMSVAFSARVTAHVNNDAHLEDYDAVVDFEISVAARTVGPAGLVHGPTVNHDEHLRLVLLGIRPGQSPIAPVGAEHVGTVSLTENGNRTLVQGSGDSVRMDKNVSNMVGFALFSIGGQADAIFGGAERLFAHDFCLKAHFSPEITPTGTQTIAVDVTDRENKAVRISLGTSVNGGTVSPASADASPGHPAHFVFTPDSKTGPVFLGVAGKSNRGTVSAATTAQRADASAYAFDVTVHGTGNYSETDDFSSTASGQHETYNDPGFTFTSHWPLTAIPADGKPPTQSDFYGESATMSGSVHDIGTHSSGGVADASYDCTGQLAPPGNPAQNQIHIGSPDPQGAVAIALNGFSGLSAVASAGTCSHSGSYWSNPAPQAGGMGIGDVAAATVGNVRVSQAMLHLPTFTIALSGSLGGSCTAAGSNAFGRTCTHAMDWSATATFIRKGTCRRGVNGYSCSLGSAADDQAAASRVVSARAARWRR
jgi:hypothetical protein